MQITIVSEAEREAAEAAIAARLGQDAPKPYDGAAGGSPYSPETVVYVAAGAAERGARVSVRSICQSHNGAGRYKGRGRWRTVVLAAPADGGDRAVCAASDRDAEQVGSSGYYTRPWTTHEYETRSDGMGLASDVVADAFAALGL